MKPVYLLAVFYNKVNKSELGKVPPLLNSLSNGDYTAIEYNGSSASFAFTSELLDRQLHLSLKPIVSENLRYLLVELSSVVSTSISQKTVDWLHSRLTTGQK